MGEAADGSRRVRRLEEVRASRRARTVEVQEAARRSPDEVGAGRKADMESGLEVGMVNVRAVVVPGCNHYNHSRPAEVGELPIGPGEAVL